MSTSRCGNIYIRHGFSNAVVLMQHDRETLCVSRRKQKHFIWPSDSRCSLKSLRLLTTEQHNPDVITTHLMDDRFMDLGEEVILTLL